MINRFSRSLRILWCELTGKCTADMYRTPIVDHMERIAEDAVQTIRHMETQRQKAKSMQEQMEQEIRRRNEIEAVLRSGAERNRKP